jgi:hypothetical protein
VIAEAPALVTTLDDGELDRVLVHEWAHVRRRDDVVNVLQIAVRIVAGWHPAVWWIDRRLQAEREVACDETTVAITGAPKSYAACLVKLAGLRGANGGSLAAPAVLSASGLRARVTRILSRHAFLAPRQSRVLAAAIAAVLLVVSGAVAQTRLVEQTAFVFPYESLPTAAVRVESLVPAAPPPMPLPRRAAPAVRQTETAAGPAAASFVVDHVQTPEPAVPLDPPRPVPPAASAGVGLAAPQPTVDAPVVASSPTSEAVPAEPEKTPWASAADGGKALGRKSKEAGVATAGAFSRFARRVAGAF